MFSYIPERKYFLGEIKAKDIKIENVTSDIEEAKFQKMKSMVLKLAKLLKVEEFGNNEIVSNTAYQMDLQEIKAIKKTGCVNPYSAMLLAEKILTQVGIENYRLIAYEEEEKNLEEEIEPDINGELLENTSTYFEVSPIYINLYKYKGTFYGLDFIYLTRKQEGLMAQRFYHDMLMQIPTDCLQWEYSEIDVEERPKRDEKNYEDLKQMPLEVFLDRQIQQKMKYQKQMGFDK